MSRVLSELLNAEEPLFGLALKQLEQASGNTSVDVRLTAEIIGKVHMRMRALGLDPADTTGAELYAALIGLLHKHDDFLAQRIGCSDAETVDAILNRVKETVQALDVPKTAWVLKHSVAKRLLHATPPLHVMKQLKYRSVDSMIKREPTGILFAAMELMESREFTRKFKGAYAKLKPADFETRHIEVLYVDHGKWGAFAEQYVQNNRHNMIHIKETGTIVLMPVPLSRRQGVTITSLALVLHYINEIRLYSSFFKSQQIKPEFAQIVTETLLDDPGKHAAVGGQHVHWRVIHKHFGAPEREHPQIFEPHVEPEDLVWRKTEETLYRLEPALHFWHDMDYVGVQFQGRQVSFNLMDVAVSYLNGLPYGEQSVQYMRDSLWNEIYLRYMGEKTVEKQVLNQLNHEMIEPDILALDL